MQDTQKKDVVRESPTGNSFLTAFTDCPKQWAFKYLMQWQPDRDKIAKDYFVFGQAFHLFKEMFYKNRNDAIKDPLQFLAIGNKYLEDNSSSFDSITNILLKERLETAVKMWLDQYGDDHDNYEVIGAELEGYLTLPNNFKLSVRYDAVLRGKETGYVYILDSKTTRASLTDTIEKYRYSPQTFIYCASILKSDYPWKNTFRGWITDAIFQKKYVKTGWKTEIKRSEAVYYTEESANELLKSLTLLTDEMLFCTESFVNDKKSLGESFRMDRSKCYQKYNGLCPYYYDCLKKWSIDDAPDPPESYTKDSWKGLDIITNNLSGIFKNETKTIKGLG